MSSYYTEKRQAISMIDELFKNGATKEVILFKVETTFGFGRKMVNERLELLEKILEQSEGK